MLRRAFVYLRLCGELIRLCKGTKQKRVDRQNKRKIIVVQAHFRSKLSICAARDALPKYRKLFIRNSGVKSNMKAANSLDFISLINQFLRTQNKLPHYRIFRAKLKICTATF